MPQRLHHYFNPMHLVTLLTIPSITVSYSKVENETCCVSCGYENWPVKLYDSKAYGHSYP